MMKFSDNVFNNGWPSNHKAHNDGDNSILVMASHRGDSGCIIEKIDENDTEISFNVSSIQSVNRSMIRGIIDGGMTPIMDSAGNYLWTVPDEIRVNNIKK